MTAELKLEVGKKYHSHRIEFNPFTCVYETTNRYLAVNRNNDEFWISKNDLPFIDSIKEYREPFKKIEEGWVGYDESLDQIPYRIIYKTKENVLRLWKHAVKIRQTTEELPEEENHD